MKVLVTGAKGFIGKNLITSLLCIEDIEIFEYDLNSSIEELEYFTKNCEFIFHLAGINRPKDEKDFMEGNFGFTDQLLRLLKKFNNTCPIMISSSIQAEIANPYGKSKRAGEDLIFQYCMETGAKIMVYRFPNVFGKWCKPNYNSVIATFSHNIANNLPIKINDPNVQLSLVYIDDVIKELINALDGMPNIKNNYCFVKPVYSIKLIEVVDLLYSFKKNRETLELPNLDDPFIKKLYSNYLSYLPKDEFSYNLKMNVDNRGSFTEFIKSSNKGQVSVNISKPGIIKGNHWHHSKNEKFLVVSGKGVIRFRRINESDIIEYYVSGEKLQVVDIPPGYTHNIENLGEVDMVTIMWANEKFDSNNPDTIYLEV